VLRDDLGVFASASKGSDATGDGTMASPFATASHALTFAKAHGKRVFLCAETYAENLTLENGVSMFGGLDCSQPKWTVSATRAHFAAPASPAARADNLTTTTTIEAVEIFAPDATTPSGSSIGLIANASPALGLTNVWIQAGNAMDGTWGVEGAANGLNTAGAPSVNPVQCTNSVQCQAYAALRPQGGSSACGANGGSGGKGGAWQSTPCGQGFICPGVQSYYWNQVFNAGAGDKLVPVDGKPGAPGASGALGTFSAAGYAAGNGVAGSSGTAGAGGSGGDGAQPNISPEAQNTGESYSGIQGPGGGAGGCGGNAGTAGTGGGASVALIAVASPLRLISSRLASANGGNGGAGTFGSAATNGTQPGAHPLGAPAGTRGGNGGEAGVSGAGAGGHSVAIAYQGALPLVDAASTLSPGTPGNGQAEQSNGSKMIGASANGVSQPIYSF
jgi:hypothetical protein